MSDAIDRYKTRRIFERLEGADPKFMPSLSSTAGRDSSFMPSLSAPADAAPAYAPSLASEVQLRAPDGVTPISSARGYQLKDPSQMFASTPSAAYAMPVDKQQGFFSKNVPGINRPVWQVMIGAIGVGAVGFGVYKLSTRGR